MHFDALLSVCRAFWSTYRGRASVYRALLSGLVAHLSVCIFGMLKASLSVCTARI